MNTQATLEKLDACLEARQWAGDRPWYELWQTCPRGDWLLWGLGKLEVDRKVLVRPAVACAALFEGYIPPHERRPAQALEITRKWLRGEATIEEVREAAEDARDAATDAYWAYDAARADEDADTAAYAAGKAAAADAYWAARAVEDAVRTAVAVYAEAAARAITTAYAATNATSLRAAAYAEDAETTARWTTTAVARITARDAAARAGAAAAVKVATDRQCADLVREHVQWSDVEVALPKGVD